MCDPSQPLLDVYDRLRTATPAERSQVVLDLVEAQPGGHLNLSQRDGQGAMLNEIDLSQERLRGVVDTCLLPPSWWDGARQVPLFSDANLAGAQLQHAQLQGADFRRANLAGASLRLANLQAAFLEEADLQDADLAGANLQSVNLEQGRLAGAMLEEAQLQHAQLRFVTLSDAILDSANLRGADLWGACLDRAVLVGVDLSGVRLDEANLEAADLSDTDLQQAILRKANLQRANLRGADLRGAVLRGANLSDAVLQNTQLQGVDLTTCFLTHISLGGAWLDKTRIRQDQLGGALGEELNGDYAQAGRGYLALERNFLDLGDPDAASWAYRKKRRMQKRALGSAAQTARSRGEWRAAVMQYLQYARDQFVEWLCDYGESLWRLLGSMLLVYMVFTVVYGLTGSVVRVIEAPSGITRVVTREPLDLAIFSLLAMTTSGSPVVGLVPRAPIVHLLTGFQALLGIGLTGLLGFVIGNRIRR